MAGILLGEQSGIFAKHCLKVEESDVSSPPTAITAVLGGSADITSVPINNIVTTAEQGVQLRVVGPNLSIPANALSLPPAKVDYVGVYAAKGNTISSAKDLAGMKVGVAGRGTQSEIGVAAAVSADGGDPAKINWAVLDQPTMLQQLQAGKLDAATVTSPFTSQLESLGYQRALSPSLALFKPGANFNVWVTAAKDLDAKHGAMQTFHEAILEVNEYARAHPDEIDQLVADKTKASLAAIKSGPGVSVNDDVVLDRDITPVAGTLLKLGYIKKMPDLTSVIGIR
ncbi:ABC transporter substrate-binding protein [Streptomyces brasiliensis]|nr:ABC transporter substrate-binding protein [Streptomyces brasiliensis]